MRSTFPQVIYDNEDLLKETIIKFGLEAQLGMVQEECAELIQAINKLRRKNLIAGNVIKYGPEYNNFVTELIQVKLMIAQIESVIPAYNLCAIEQENIDNLKTLVHG
jgi:hypothetical protein